MRISSWLCTSSHKNMVVKIVHAGGRTELHERPVLAADIMVKNPRCVVAHTHVFRQPWAVVAPDTLLMLGQKFYVVPVNTIRKLQRHALRYSASPGLDRPADTAPANEDEKVPDVSRCIPMDRCFECFGSSNATSDDASEVTRSSAGGSPSTYETRELLRKRNRDRSPKKCSPLDQWRLRLERIVEE